MMAEPRSSTKYEELFAPGLAKAATSKVEVGLDESIIADNRPHPVDLKTGESYWFCTCGRSAKQPFCDGSHKGTDFVPQKFTAEEDREAWLCYCKQTSNVPFCDGTHKQFENNQVGKPRPKDG
jgi:CDGSH-type Zn-finger protein